MSGDVVLDFATTFTSSFTTTFPVALTDTQIGFLESRAYYVNLHTSTAPGGEIRGQLLTPGETLYTANLAARSGVTTTGAGQFGIVKLNDGTFVYSGGAAGMNNDASAAEIDKSSDSTKEMDINMTATVKTGVVFQGTYLSTALTGSLLDAAAGSGYFVNVATSVDTAGEIRGNLLKQFTAPAP